MQALKARRRKARHTVVVFREHRLFVEKNRLAQTPESMRLMMLRDQVSDLIGIMREHGEAVEIVCQLLKDGHVGVGAIAADVLKEAMIAGVDVSAAENALAEALNDRYAKRNAAGALALIHMKKGDVAALGGLLAHRDSEVRDGAGAACTHGAGGGDKV
ncbi:hypothetical protein L0Y65_01080 [Candidatus Micrarchaeota archaeon]|nr:hypothetical protein [Candidatus Micrarchaeota archaeon]